MSHRQPYFCPEACGTGVSRREIPTLQTSIRPVAYPVQHQRSSVPSVQHLNNLVIPSGSNPSAVDFQAASRSQIPYLYDPQRQLDPTLVVTTGYPALWSPKVVMYNNHPNKSTCTKTIPSLPVENFVRVPRTAPEIISHDSSIPPRSMSSKSINFSSNKADSLELSASVTSLPASRSNTAMKKASNYSQRSLPSGLEPSNSPSGTERRHSSTCTLRSTLPGAKSVISKKTSNGGGPQKKVRSSKSNIPGTSRYWTPSEHKLFILALLKYGPKDLKSIADYVGTRNTIQCRTHEQKCFMRLMREAQRETELRVANVYQAQGPAGDSSQCGHESQQKTGDGSEPATLSSTSTAVDMCSPVGCISTSPSQSSSWSSDVAVTKTEKNTYDNNEPASSNKSAKDVYSVPASCGLTLLCVVSEEMSRALSC